MADPQIHLLEAPHRRGSDASPKVARSFYLLPLMTDNVLSVSLGQWTGLAGEVLQHSNVVKSFSSYSARQQASGGNQSSARTLGPEQIGRTMLLIYKGIYLMIRRDPQIGDRA